MVVNSSQSVITIPSKNRIGILPAVIVIVTGALTFILSFQSYFYLPEILLQEDMTFPMDVLDTLSMMSLPSTLLYMFIANQLRYRLNLSIFNFWTITEAILSVASLASNILYILARPEECLQIVKGLDEDSINELDKIIKSIQSWGLSKLLEDPNATKTKVLMYFVTYSFILQTLFMLIYTTMSCTIYGETQYIFTIQEENNKYKVDVKARD